MASSRKSGRWGAMSRNSCPVWQKTDRLSARLFVGLGEGIRDTKGHGSVGGAFLQKRFRSRTARHSFDRMSCRPGDPSLERQKRKSPCITECTGVRPHPNRTGLNSCDQYLLARSAFPALSAARTTDSFCLPVSAGLAARASVSLAARTAARPASSGTFGETTSERTALPAFS